VTQKKHRISPEDIDLGKLRQTLLDTFPENTLKHILRQRKLRIARDERICGWCVGRCKFCAIIFLEATGPNNHCPCDVYLKKDVVHVVQYFLLNLKI